MFSVLSHQLLEVLKDDFAAFQRVFFLQQQDGVVTSFFPSIPTTINKNIDKA